MDMLEWFWEQIEADDTLSEDAQLLVVSAVAGEADFLNWTSGNKPERPAPARSKPTPQPAFLTEIAAEGYRGIGAPARLSFAPAPGLVVIAGRNGSGKTSLAEALDWCLTQSTTRAQKDSRLWEDQWRNLHHPTPTQLSAGFVVEGQGKVTIGVQWADDESDPENHQVWTQREGEKRQPGIDSLGWQEALELYSPILSYDGIGGIFEGRPHELFDALHNFLGLDRLTEAAKLLRDYANELAEPEKQAKATAKAAKPKLAEVDDSRAEQANRVIRSRNPSDDDLATLAATLTGATQTDPTIAALNQLANYTVPAQAELSAAAAAVIQTSTELAAATEQGMAAQQDQVQLLAEALDYHEQHGDSVCPVCGVGALDTTWQTQAAAKVTQSRQLAQHLSAAQQANQSALHHWRELQPVRPAALSEAGLDEKVQASLDSAWQRWETLSLGAPTAETIEQVQAGYLELQQRVTELAATASQELQQRQDRWIEVLPLVTEWLDAFKRASAVANGLATARQAQAWLKGKSEELRAQRLAPLAEQAREIWGKLRQESNVELGAISLEGTSTRRHVSLAGSVDGEPVGGLAVMSTGELHALGLALFIPRACSSASPFGFLVLDDPIQAMDPSKVDGLVDLLSGLAKTRQVVVFSHDNRLPEALNRMGVPALVLEIIRGADSQIRVQNITSPVDRYLSDARAITYDDAATIDDMKRVIPGLCRMAVETACQEIFYARELGRGRPRAEVEADWQQHQKTSARVQAALETDHQGLDQWLRGKSRSRQGLGICTSGFHKGLEHTDPRDAVAATQQLIDDLQAST